MPRLDRQAAGYLATLVVCFLVAQAGGWTDFAGQVDGVAYDVMFRLSPPATKTLDSVILAIDEGSLKDLGGMRKLRGALAEALERISPQRPKAVAVDLVLPDAGEAADDDRLEEAFAKTPHLVLASDIVPGSTPGAMQWENPIEQFRRHALAVGHVHAAPDPVSRQLPLEKAVGRDRRWALALEAFRATLKDAAIIETPDALEIGHLTIPAARSTARALYISYPELRPDGQFSIPHISLKQLHANPALASQFRNKVVFAGVTAQTAARDRLITPYGTMMTGVEIHACAYESLAGGEFLEPASDIAVVAFSLLLTVAAGAVFRFRYGWQAYALGGMVLTIAHLAPYLMFAGHTVFPYFAPVSVAWLTVAGAASYQHFVVRRRLARSETESARYQQAIHFVTHEMRTPLTAIQGSSELMTRYNLNDEKRKQIAQLINSESRRLARMVETFLNVERLSEGQMDLKRESFPVSETMLACIERARPLAERKRIELRMEPLPEATLVGDRELMEYAFYNLLNNAIKYSPVETLVTVAGEADGHRLRLSVRDQGIGMDEKEVRQIFKKFYRTKRAEASGESGTGIGLSIVEQIITHHGGTIEVASAPGKGSCFTLSLPLAAGGAAARS
jgi:signal transduction histidine kinase